LVHVARSRRIAFHPVRDFRTRHARIIQAHSGPVNLGYGRKSCSNLNNVSRLFSRLGTKPPSSRIDKRRADISRGHRSPGFPNKECRQHTAGASFARFRAPFSRERPLKKGTHFSVHDAGTPRAIADAMERSTKLRGRCHGARTLLYWCAGLAGSEPAQPPPSTATVTVAPSNASVLLGGPQTFTATVSNTSNAAVTWSVDGVPGGNAAVGTIDADGMYVARQILTSSPSMSLTATSVADSAKSATRTITITSLFSLAVTGPPSGTAGNTAAYTATLTPAAGSNPTRVILWSVAGTGCTGAAGGTID